MDLTPLRIQLEARHHNDQQALRRIQWAIEHLSEGLGTLASLGHPMHLEPELRRLELGWPRILFHADSAPNGRIVYGQAEADELGPDWFASANEAAHADGVKTQFAGRGGIQTRSVPAIIVDEIAKALDFGPTNDERIAEWKLERIKELLK